MTSESTFVETNQEEYLDLCYRNYRFDKEGMEELAICIMRLSKNIKENKANEIAEEILQVVDWNSSALMHKGFSWMAKNYLNQQKKI